MSSLSIDRHGIERNRERRIPRWSGHLDTDDHPEVDERDELDTLGVLAEPNRRALYEYVVARRDWVSREQAADAVGLRRGIAAHHLDRLAGVGLLDVDYRRLTQRRGPGAGRPAKVYRRAAAEFAVSLPAREYELAGRLLADAADRSQRDGIPVADAIEQSARDEGRAIGADTRQLLRPARVRPRAAPASSTRSVPTASSPRPSTTGLRSCTTVRSTSSRSGTPSWSAR